MSYIKILIKYIVLSFIIAYFVGGFVLYLKQGSEIYFPDDQDFYSCKIMEDTEKIEFQGTRLYYKANSDKLVVYYHSNTGSACNSTFFKELYEELNLSYILVEYAGYANDNRNPTKKLILKDVENINEFIRTIEYSQLIFVGYSIGTGPASYHSKLTEVDKVLLIAPYSSIYDIAKLRKSVYPVSVILRENYDNELYLKDYKNKLMIIHGTKDLMIPIEFSKKLFNSVHSEKKEFVEVKNAEHSDILDYEETVNKIKEFIKK